MTNGEAMTSEALNSFVVMVGCGVAGIVLLLVAMAILLVRGAR